MSRVKPQIPRSKVPVAILGATGSVGQKFIQLLSGHPWFNIVALAASERSAGKRYSDACRWLMNTPLPDSIGSIIVQKCTPDIQAPLVLSALDAAVAGDIEESFANAGYLVVSNSKNHRMNSRVPLVIPEVNGAHLDAALSQPYGTGRIVTNPNCSVIGLAIALKPLDAAFGIEAVHVVTLQALSGAGFPGVASVEIIDNVVPYIGGEEDKVETEPQKILGGYSDGAFSPAPIKISATCTRVGVIDGHTECVSVRLKQRASYNEMVEAFNKGIGLQSYPDLPSAPVRPLLYFDDPSYPQPRLHRDRGNGMAVSVGRLRECALFDYKFVVLSHNTVRGAAGTAILNAELMVSKGWIDG